MKKGTKVFVRTLTNFYTGQVVKITRSWIVLKDAAWIADTGRFANALKDGLLNEVEPFVKPVYVARANVVDVTEWTHALPLVQK